MAFKLDKQALRSYLIMTSEYEIHILPNKKVSASKNHCKNYMKVRPPLVRHLWRNRVLIYRFKLHQAVIVYSMDFVGSTKKSETSRRRRRLFKLDNQIWGVRLQLHGAIYRPDSFVLMLRYCANVKAIRYESTSLNRIVADKSHRVIVA